jgi:hypothetical protein
MSLLFAARIAIIILLALLYLLILTANYIHWVLGYVEPVVSGEDVEITRLWRVAGWLWIRVCTSVIDAAVFYHRQPGFMRWMRNDAFHLRVLIDRPLSDPNQSGASTPISAAPPYLGQEVSHEPSTAPEVIPSRAPSVTPAISCGPLVAPSDVLSLSLYIPEYFFPVNGGTSQNDDDESQSRVDEEEWDQAHGDPDEESSQGGSIPGSVLAEILSGHLESRDVDEVLERGGVVATVIYDGYGQRI